MKKLILYIGMLAIISIIAITIAKADDMEDILNDYAVFKQPSMNMTLENSSSYVLGIQSGNNIFKFDMCANQSIGCHDFNGNSYVDFSSSPSQYYTINQNNGDFAISLWIKLNDTNTIKYVIDAHGTNDAHGINVYFTSAEMLYFNIFVNSIDNGYIPFSYSNFPTDNYVHLLMNYNNSGKRAYFYINGTFMESKSEENSGWANTNNHFTFGTDLSSSNFMAGIIQGLYMFNKTLNTSEIAKLSSKYYILQDKYQAPLADTIPPIIESISINDTLLKYFEHFIISANCSDETSIKNIYLANNMTFGNWENISNIGNGNYGNAYNYSVELSNNASYPHVVGLMFTCLDTSDNSVQSEIISYNTELEQIAFEMNITNPQNNSILTNISEKGLFDNTVILQINISLNKNAYCYAYQNDSDIGSLQINELSYIANISIANQSNVLKMEFNCTNETYSNEFNIYSYKREFMFNIDRPFNYDNFATNNVYFNFSYSQEDGCIMILNDSIQNDWFYFNGIETLNQIHTLPFQNATWLIYENCSDGKSNEIIIGICLDCIEAHISPTPSQPTIYFIMSIVLLMTFAIGLGMIAKKIKLK